LNPLYFTGMRIRSGIVLTASVLGLFAQPQFTPGVRPFIAVDAPVIALEHVRILDGTGAPAREDQTIVIESGRVIPGLVGMHEHLFYPSGGVVPLYMITVGYLDGHDCFAPQMAVLDTPDDARRFVEYWARMGRIPSRLHAHHARGLKVTGHLCSWDFAKRRRSGSIAWSTAWWWIPNSIPASSRTSVRKALRRSWRA
jgi:hypothetical protein